MLELAQPKFEAAGVSDRIEVLVGSATDSINKLQKGGKRFDIAFLDADKTGYLGYYSQLMDNQLINPGGIIVVDNALMKVCSFVSTQRCFTHQVISCLQRPLANSSGVAVALAKVACELRNASVVC